MITKEQAEKAQVKLLEHLGNPSWLLGIGLAIGNDGDYKLKVLVSEENDSVPSVFENVMIEIRLTKSIKAL